MIDKKKPKFLRRGTKKLLKLGKRRKKKQKWRRARGRHNKIRKKEKSYAREPAVGYGTPKKIKGTIKGLKPLLIKNMDGLKKANEKNIIILSRQLGKKKRIEIMKKIEERKLKIKKY
jgi:large subunit ribosomal protein L32e